NSGTGNWGVGRKPVPIPETIRTLLAIACVN
ncbi:hypothetical protein NJB1808_07200, partial [Mycobacterium marinum]